MAWGAGVLVHFLACMAICFLKESVTFLKTVGMRKLHDVEVVSVAKTFETAYKGLFKTLAKNSHPPSFLRIHNQ
jgi:hypothetical protein